MEVLAGDWQRVAPVHGRGALFLNDPEQRGLDPLAAARTDVEELPQETGLVNQAVVDHRTPHLEHPQRRRLPTDGVIHCCLRLQDVVDGLQAVAADVVGWTSQRRGKLLHQAPGLVLVAEGLREGAAVQDGGVKEGVGDGGRQMEAHRLTASIRTQQRDLQTTTYLRCQRK